jgi:MFS family permease
VLSLTGDWVLLTGLLLVVYQLTGSTLALAVTVLAATLPRVIVSSFAGVFVDRWDRRRTMFVCNVLLGLGLLPLLLVHSADRLWLVTLVLLFESTVVQFYRPAEGALLPLVVPEAELVPANALNGLSTNVARLSGPPLGAFLVALGGLDSVVLFDAASFLVGALTVALVRVARVDHTDAQVRSAVWHEWLAGLEIVRRQSVPRMLFVFLAITGVGEGLISALFVPFATRVLHGSEITFGALVSAQAAGGLVGSLLLGRFGSAASPAKLLGGAAVVFGVLDLCIFYSPLVSSSLLVPLLLMVAVGLPSVAIGASALLLVQTFVADAQRGRVLGALFAVSALSGLIGTGVAGVLGDVVGIVPLLTVQGLGYVMAGALVLVTGLVPSHVPDAVGARECESA